jgi:hypothetical protein
MEAAPIVNRMLVLVLPILAGFWFGIKHFEKLENAKVADS